MHASPEVVHLLVRYRDPAPEVDTIREHEKLLAEHGAVWFGKFGKAVGIGTVDRMREQVRGGVPTFLYLTTRRDQGQLQVHRGHVEHLTGGTPPPADQRAL